jgi:hypothetical protein
MFRLLVACFVLGRIVNAHSWMSCPPSLGANTNLAQVGWLTGARKCRLPNPAQGPANGCQHKEKAFPSQMLRQATLFVLVGRRTITAVDMSALRSCPRRVVLIRRPLMRMYCMCRVSDTISALDDFPMANGVFCCKDCQTDGAIVRIRAMRVALGR